MSEVVQSLGFADLARQSVSKLCWCWTLTRKDGEVMGFTDHDRDIVLLDVIHKAKSGLTGADIDRKVGFATDNSSAQGLLSDEAIRPQDIDAGLYDGADVLITRVSWEQPSCHHMHWRGSIGSIVKSGGRFTVELLGQSALLARHQGRVFSSICDAEFGDARCGVNKADYPETVSCPRNFRACQSLFANSHNFRGFPYLIGNDALQAGPEPSAIMDGGSRYRESS